MAAVLSRRGGSANAHRHRQIAAQSLQVVFTGRRVLLVTNVGYLLIFIRKDGFSGFLNLREENAPVPILSLLSTSAPCQKSRKSKTKTSGEYFALSSEGLGVFSPTDLPFINQLPSPCRPFCPHGAGGGTPLRTEGPVPLSSSHLLNAKTLCL